MRVLLITAAVLMLAGCVSSAKTVLPDGRQGQIVSCPGLAHSMADCWAKAAEVCPKGYDVVGTDAESATAYSATPGYAFGGSVMQRALMVSCK